MLLNGRIGNNDWPNEPFAKNRHQFCISPLPSLATCIDQLFLQGKSSYKVITSTDLAQFNTVSRASVVDLTDDSTTQWYSTASPASCLHNWQNGNLEILSSVQHMDHSKISSGVNKFRSGLCILQLQQLYQVDVETQYLLERSNPLLHPAGGSICFSTEQSSTHLCGTIPRCLFPSLEHADSFHPKDFTENETQQSNRATDCTLAGPTLVSSVTGNAGALSSTSTNSNIHNLPSVCAEKVASAMENSSVSRVANFRTCLKTAGIPEEVSKVLMASW